MGGSRLGNLTAAICVEEASRSRRTATRRVESVDEAFADTVQRLDRLFEETLVVGGKFEAAGPGRWVPPPEGEAGALALLAKALDAAQAERVLVVGNPPQNLPTDLILALTAWPGNEAVVLTERTDEPPVCAIYRREAVLKVAREELEGGARSVSELLDQVESSRVTLRQLGLEDLNAPGLAGMGHSNSSETPAVSEGC